MALATRLKAVADKLIKEYGNTIVFTDKNTDGYYDPQTGLRNITEVTYNKKGQVKNITEADLKIAKIPDNLFGKISTIITVVSDEDLVNINNRWLVNDLSIHKIIKITSQDTYIVFKIYAG